MKQLKRADLKGLRLKWFTENKGICPILKKEYPIEDFCIDHQHKLKNELPDETGKGLCRGSIHLQANSLEGKILKSFNRLGLKKHIDLVSYLRNLADYLESNKIHTEEKLIHPNEAPLKKKLMKSSYNKLVKAINGKQSIPEYKDKRGNLSEPLKKLFIKYNIEPVLK